MKAALDDLLKDAPILAGMKFVHWFDREIPQRMIRFILWTLVMICRRMKRTRKQSRKPPSTS